MNRKYVIQLHLSTIFLALSLIMARCVTSPTWQKKNEELINEHNLTKREIGTLPESLHHSNLDDGQVKSLENIGTTKLYPGVDANVFWGSGVMAARLQVEPNAEISEEELPSDKFLFVVDGSIDQLINGSRVNMIGKKREEPDGIHSGTPRTDLVYLLKGAKSALKAGASGATLLELYSPVRLDYLQKAGFKDLPIEIADVAARI